MSTHHLPDPFRADADDGLDAGVDAGDQGRERRERPDPVWPFYRSGYVSTFLAGRLQDGSDFALVAGAHGRHFPYYDPRSQWDDLLLVAGDRGLLAAGRRLPPLSLVLGEGSAVVAYHGLAAAAGGAAAPLVDIDLDLELHATFYRPRSEGLGRGRLLLGLLWQPALLRGRGTLALNGARHRIDLVAGEMERGTLLNLRSPLFRFAYDYLGVTRAGAEPAAQVAFRVRPLARGLAALPLQLALALARAHERLTLAGDAPVRGDPRALGPAPGDEVAPIVESVVDLGPARLTRQLVRVGGPLRPRWGLREEYSSTR